LTDGAPGEQDLVVAGPAYAAALASLHAAAFADPPFGGHEQWRETDFIKQLSRPNVRALIDPRGGLILVRVAADEAEILTVGVVPAARRQGIGRRLLRAAGQWAAARGAAALFLEVAAEDAGARAFYLADGFHQFGRRQQYYSNGGDALVLRLSLCAAAGS
jgi:ribosomal-protein-alanine N-acetyltransferase